LRHSTSKNERKFPQRALEDVSSKTQLTEVFGCSQILSQFVDRHSTRTFPDCRPFFRIFLHFPKRLKSEHTPVEHDQKTTTSKPFEKPKIAGLG
jgi:hypothetical protein